MDVSWRAHCDNNVVVASTNLPRVCLFRFPKRCLWCFLPHACQETLTSANIVNWFKGSTYDENAEVSHLFVHDLQHFPFFHCKCKKILGESDATDSERVSKFCANWVEGKSAIHLLGFWGGWAFESRRTETHRLLALVGLPGESGCQRVSAAKDSRCARGAAHGEPSDCSTCSLRQRHPSTHPGV